MLTHSNCIILILTLLLLLSFDGLMLVQVEKFLEHTMLLQESLSRDNFKQLKRTLVPRVANSQAKELIERRPSCLALLDGFDLTAGEHLLGAARSVAALSDDDSTSWKSLPDDGRDEAINLQGVPVKNLKDVTRMTRIVEEDQSVAWAAQVSGDAGISSNNRRSVIRGNVDDDADYLLQPPSDDDEHRVWIPLPFMPKSVHYQQHPTASTHSHAKRSNHLSNYSNGSPEDNKTISQKTTLDGDTRRLRPTAIEYEDRWYEEMDGRPLLALKTVETTELHSLYISEVSSGSDTSSDSDSDHNDDAEKGTCRDDVDVSILMDEDEGDANSELTSLAWSDSDDDRDEHTEPL